MSTPPINPALNIANHTFAAAFSGSPAAAATGAAAVFNPFLEGALKNASPFTTQLPGTAFCFGPGCPKGDCGQSSGTDTDEGNCKSGNCKSGGLFKGLANFFKGLFGGFFG